MTTPPNQPDEGQAEKRNAAQLINQSSGDVEIYTPGFIIEAARVALGGRISLDPASSELANQRVKADCWFGKEDRSMERGWDGPLWMNHPYGRAEKACEPGCCKDHVHHDFEWFGNARWINKLIYEHDNGNGNVKTACCITFASTSEGWFRPLLDYPQCYLWPRTNYLKPDGSIYRGVTKGSVVTYFGRDIDLFRQAFKGLGTVKV